MRSAQHTRPSHRKPALSTTANVAVLLLLSAAWPAVLAVADEHPLTPAQLEELPRYYGFGQLEVFKFDPGITQVRAADVNNDGATDIVLANNAKSTIEVLIQRRQQPEALEKPKDANDLVNPWRFERKKVSINWQVASLQARDVTGDGNVDLVFTGDPKELVVLPGNGDGSFRDPMTRRVRDLLTIPDSLAVADVNADGRTDIVVLTASDVIVYEQPAEGGIGRPTPFAHAIDGPLFLAASDLTGDGRSDLILMSNDDTYPLHVRCQNEIGQLGPAERIRLPALRSIQFASTLGRTREDLLGVERVSGRLKRWVLRSEANAEAESEWAVRVYPLPGKSDAKRLPLAVGDVTGDGLIDVVSANIEAAQLVLFTQRKGIGLQNPQLFGGQVEMADMSCVDADGDGADELYVLSSQEETIARSLFKDDRLTFPHPIPTKGRPYALAMGKASEDGDTQLAFVSKTGDSGYELIVQPLQDEAPAEEKLTRLKLEGLEDPPAGLAWADVNQDGRNDLLVFASFGPLTAVLQGTDGGFRLLGKQGDAQSGLVKKASQAGFAYADTDGDGHRDVVLAQGAFVRALRIGKNDAWEAIDQYNAPTSDADVTGVCAVTLKGTARPALAMYDRKAQEVHYYAPGDAGTYQLKHSVPVGAFDLKGMTSAPLGGTASPSILLADDDRIAVVLPDIPARCMDEVGVYESSIKDAWLSRTAVGDLNHDGRSDLAVVDNREHFVEILTFAPDESLVRATKFRVFTEKRYNTDEQNRGEPRWITIADVTGDKIDDLILIAHDRLLLYPGR